MKNAARPRMPKSYTPCNGCAERFVAEDHTCHSVCEKYKAYKDERLKLYKEITSAAIEEMKLDAVQIKGCQKRGHRKVTVR